MCVCMYRLERERERERVYKISPLLITNILITIHYTPDCAEFDVLIMSDFTLTYATLMITTSYCVE